MKENVLKKHPALSLQKDIKEIHYPFLKKFNYQTLCTLRVYDDNRLLYLCDYRDMLFNYFIKNYPAIGPLENNQGPRKERCILWNALQGNGVDSMTIDCRTMFSLKFGVIIAQPFEQGIDFFSFGTTDGDISTLNRVNSQLEELTVATKLIIDKSKSIITKIAKQPLKSEDFSPNAKPVIKNDRLYLGIDYDYNYLTRKEIIYLQHLKNGNTLRDIARLNDVSTRTVEKHFEHIKHKLFCKTQYELGYLVAKLGIDSL